MPRSHTIVRSPRSCNTPQESAICRIFVIGGLTIALACTSLVGTVRADQDSDEFDPYKPVTTQYVEILPPFGLFYHRVDHLRTFGTEQVIPEEARERGFLPDPISRPPDSTLALEEEMTRGRRNISPYYASVLKDRRKPISDIPPRGAVPGLTTGGVGRTAPDSGPGAPAASGARKSGGNAP